MSGLALAGVTKRYRDGARGEVTAVGEVSLAVAPGETVVVKGASGAGKSTLLALASGVVLPTRGEVSFAGEPFSRLREAFRARVRRTRMGVVLQSLALVPGMTAIENTLLAGVPDGAVDKPAIARAYELLERLGVGALARSRVESLSGGERQRVALARALVFTPEALVLDEPTAHLDDARTSQVAELLAEHAARGGLALVATHDPRLVGATGVSRVVEMVEGVVKG